MASAASPSPRFPYLSPLAGRGRTTSSDVVRVRGTHGESERVESPPHPPRIWRCASTSPRKPGEVREARFELSRSYSSLQPRHEIARVDRHAGGIDVHLVGIVVLLQPG